ncbi:hypothetical protein R6Q59_027729 [Mikania micrantha]
MAKQHCCGDSSRDRGDDGGGDVPKETVEKEKKGELRPPPSLTGSYPSRRSSPSRRPYDASLSSPPSSYQIVGIKKKQCKGEQDIGFCSKFTKVKIFVILSSSSIRPKVIKVEEVRSKESEPALHEGSSIGIIVVRVLPNNRNPKVWCNWNLCEMSDESSKARCKFCGALLGKESNTTLKKHILKFCKGKKENPDSNQMQIGVDGGIFMYDVNMVRDIMSEFEIQEGFSFDLFVYV